MKLYGDVTQKAKDHSEELEIMEKSIQEAVMFSGKKAQAYVCLASDWYDLEMEDEGERLLLKAESVYPGYFGKLILEHIKADPDFDILVRNIASELAKITVQYLNSIKDKK